MLASQLDGLLLDPVYSGKGFAGPVGLVRAGFLKNDDNVVFLYTRGASAPFACQEALSTVATATETEHLPSAAMHQNQRSLRR
jgi:L-cysteate sulfo-lyase